MNDDATPLSRRADLGLANRYEPPREGAEAQAAALFAAVLNVDLVGATDEFFDLGGDSLLAEELALRIEQTFGTEFPLHSLFDYGSPRAIAGFLRGEDRAGRSLLDRLKGFGRGKD